MSDLLKKLQEPFTEEFIEWRLAECGKNTRGFWGKCLAYIQARAVMDRLDAVVGPENWKVRYEFVPGGVLCGLSLRVSSEWIEKIDGADATDIEAFKGGISGALKRAAVLWGIGRYLYDLEEGWVQVVEQGTKGARYGKTKEKETFYWTPPKLPAWALPTTSKNTGSPHVPVHGGSDKKPTQHHSAHAQTPKTSEVPTMDRVEAEKIMISATGNGWSTVQVLEYTQKKYGAMRLGEISKDRFDELMTVVSKRRPEVALLDLTMRAAGLGPS